MSYLNKGGRLNRLWAKARESELARHGSILFVALTVGNLSNYIFHVVISRMLGPADYGALGALLSVFILISVPAGALQTVVAKRISILRARNELDEAGVLLRSLLRGGSMFALYCGILVAAWAPAISHFLKLGSLIPGFLLAAFVVPAVLAPVARGALQGHLRFKALAKVSVVTTLLRLVFGVIFVGIGWGVSGAVAASVVSEVLGVVLALLPLRKDIANAAKGKIKLVGIVKEAQTAMLALGGFWAVVSLDSVLVRALMSERDSGIYAAAAVLAHAVLFLPGAIAVVAFPRFAESSGKSVQARRVLFQSLVAVFVLGVGAAVFLSALGPLAVRLLFGSSFQTGGFIVGILGFAMALMGVASILIYFHLASHSRALWALAVAVVSEVAMIAMFHDSLLQVSMVMLGTSGLLMAFNLVAAYASPSEIEVLSEPGKELWDQQTEGLDLTVVTPSFNPGPNYAANLRSLFDALESGGITYEVIAVSDGSTDGSHSVAAEFAHRAFKLIHYDKNMGKGYALRTGLARARGRYVAFIDSDGDLNPSEIRSFITLMSTYDADLVVGSKRHPLSEVQYPLLRRLMSTVYYLTVRLLFGLKIKDTQTGLKLAKREVLAAVLPRMLEKRFAFDLEMLVIAKRLGFTRFFEAPVRLDYKFASTVSMRSTLGAAVDTLAIYYRCYILRFYDQGVTERISLPSAMEQVPTAIGSSEF